MTQPSLNVFYYKGINYLFAVLLLYTVLNTNNYFALAYPRFGYINLDLKIHSLIYLISLFSILLRSRFYEIGDILAFIITMMYFLPVTFITFADPFENTSLFFKFTILLSLFVFFFIILFPKIETRFILNTGNFNIQFIVVISLLICLIALILLPPQINNLSISNLISFDEFRQDLRLNQRYISINPFGQLAYGIAAKVGMSIFLAYSIYKKSFLGLLISIFLLVLLFLSGGHRSVLGVWLITFMLSIFLLNRDSDQIKFIFYIFVIFWFTLTLFDSFFSNLILDLLRRIVINPAYFPIVYAEVFGIMDSLVPTYNSDLSPAFYVGLQIHGEYGARATAGSMASMISTFGTAGPILACLLIGFTIRLFFHENLNLSNQLNRVVFLPTTIGFSWVFIDSNILTALLNQGLLFLILVIYLYRNSSSHYE